VALNTINQIKSNHNCLFTATTPLDQYTCDFEDGETCIFVDSTQDDFDWSRRSVSLLLKIFKYSQTCLMQPPKEIVKYGHIKQVSLNTGLAGMKCTVKGNKN